MVLRLKAASDVLRVLLAGCLGVAPTELLVKNLLGVLLGFFGGVWSFLARPVCSGWLMPYLGC